VHCIAHLHEDKVVAFMHTISLLANEFLSMRPPGVTGAALSLSGAAPPSPLVIDKLTEASISAAMTTRYKERVTDPISQGASNVFTFMALKDIKGSKMNINQFYGGLGHQTIDGKPLRCVAVGRPLPRWEAYHPCTMQP